MYKSNNPNDVVVVEVDDDFVVEEVVVVVAEDGARRCCSFDTKALTFPSFWDVTDGIHGSNVGGGGGWGCAAIRMVNSAMYNPETVMMIYPYNNAIVLVTNPDVYVTVGKANIPAPIVVPVINAIQPIHVSK